MKVWEAGYIWAVTLLGVYCSLCPEKRLGRLAYHTLITLHDVMFVLLCSLIKGAAVQNMAGLIEGDRQVIGGPNLHQPSLQF